MRHWLTVAMFPGCFDLHGDHRVLVDQPIEVSAKPTVLRAEISASDTLRVLRVTWTAGKRFAAP